MGNGKCKFVFCAVVPDSLIGVCVALVRFLSILGPKSNFRALFFGILRMHVDMTALQFNLHTSHIGMILLLLSQ